MKKIFWIIFGLGVFLRVYHLNLEFLEPYNSVARQSIVATVARNFYKHGFNFFYPELDENGGGPSLYNAELPVHSYLMAIGYQLTSGMKPWAARAVPVFFSIGTLLFGFALARRLYGGRFALAVLLFMALSPLNVALSRALQPESMMLCSSLGALYTFLRWKETRRVGYGVMSAFWMFLAVGSKAYNLYLFLPIAYLAFWKEGWKALRNPAHYAYAAFASLALVWYYYAWQASLSQELVHFPFKYSQRGPAGKTFTELLFSRPHIWLCTKIFLAHILTPLGVVFFAAGFFKRLRDKTEGFLFVWFFAVMILMILLWRIVIEHPYYQLPLVPISAFFVARGFERFFSIPRAWSPRGAWPRTIAVALVLIEAASLFYFYKGLYWIPERRLAILEAGKAVQAMTPENALVVASFETSSVQLYYCDRKGWGMSIVSGGEESLIEILEKYRQKGASYFVATSLGDFDRVPGFERYLNENYRPVTVNDRYVLFDLA